ncbi:16S rRNA (cytidine(1402)-2'-O)-methyltransferase [Ponticaulis sp.]|uniref:16S rRNA (cytidine(1402)-2'-O)-methyltransferase n=1 Tax=Ponticaulis sp. TaxID=2020902 RepID=UPI000B6F2001|nr:16S rRNA (cytidine(1402)-2'-O)-methyltransferase [Ponticaulis sp.]MAI91088.1 16S rRNA (cytidine(1402)-2'-O)-methyltransferase [Ponticaulis sp.]OUX98413.1 MAG: 16S rRNA (cytidine(1402)-2'-O)-methyltransferase [Hyphomonadaceae bacterium TMED5]|tara:strand:+ start:48416 stop:49321 length:906 start_codon:yes stop_codon:yes gene_type:complete
MNANEVKPVTQLIRPVDLSSALYVVATPIGNLRDVTLRALDTLAGVDVIYAEDTRQTRRLLDAYGITTSLRTYHDHNGAQMRPQIISLLEEGKSIALVSDAGTPLISDPGFKLVRDVRDEGHKVVPLPGPSALTAALSAGGLPTDTFTFAGFLPVKTGQRLDRLKSFAGQKTTLIFYETGNRLADTVSAIIEVFGAETELVMARELTKMFETIVHSEAGAFLEELNSSDKLKGEIVLMVSLTGDEAGTAGEADIDGYLLDRLESLGAKGAANAAAKEFSLSKRDLYARAVELQNAQKDKAD